MGRAAAHALDVRQFQEGISYGMTVKSLCLPKDLATRYKNPAQKARVLTEAWAVQRLYCPRCGGRLKALPANTRSRDFECTDCEESFQLKSKKGKFTASITGAEYRTTIENILADRHPSLILLEYTYDYYVETVEVIHRACITPSCIKPRRPLSNAARRAGWQGCIIRVDAIPSIGRIIVVRDGSWRPRDQVLRDWERAERFLRVRSVHRGWLAEVARILDELPEEFTLEEVYAFEGELAEKYPENRHIRAKIRQQLQKLRDLGVIEFQGRGRYRKR